RFLIAEEECSIAMTCEVLDILTVIDHSLVEQGVKWVTREIRQHCNEAGIEYSLAKWQGFWEYLKRAWLGQSDISVWDVAGLNNELVARTNNPLERFNREGNNRFPRPRPIMATFVDVLKTISAEYVQRLHDVPHGQARRPQRERIQLPEPVEIPEDIADEPEDDEPVIAELPSDSPTDEDDESDEDNEEDQ
ncbi:hypothetical protein PHMEG_00041511, partial [Phytophthora megakarya]